MAELSRERVSRVMKGVARRAGIDVTRIGRGPRRTLAEMLSHASRLGVNPATVIDVGVAAGTPELYEAFPRASLLLVEPIAEWREQLEGLGGGRRVHVESAAAGAREGEVTLHVHRVPACSSVLGARVGDDERTNQRVVPVVDIDTLVARTGFGSPYVIKIDVEGAELDVVAGATSTLEQTDLLLLEVSLFELVPGGAQLADVVCTMREKGWSVYDIYHGHLRPLDGALAQVDIAFASDRGPLRASHEYATPEQADALYRSWGH